MRTTMVDLSSPDTYLDGPPHAVLEELRRTSPVYWQEMHGEPGYWAVLTHADVVHVARNPELFSAGLGGIVVEDVTPDRLEMQRKMLLAMDPPGHDVYRRPLLPSFKARIIAGMEPRIRAICRRIFDGVGDGDVEFVHDVTSSLPTQVIGQLIGLPEEDWSEIHRWAEMNTSGQDADVGGREDPEGGIDPITRMAIYAIDFAGRRRREEPREDLGSLILGTEFGGQLMSNVDFGSFFVQLVTAGNDTTKTMLSSGLLALLEHPDQLAAVRTDPSIIPGALEEILRWANPLHYFRRTTKDHTEIGGVPIAKGDKVAMFYTSANRDEAVFSDAQAFDIHRSPNPHLSFGIAEHFCLGVHLARLEGRIFFEELLNTFSVIESAGPSRRIRSNLNNGLKRLPIHLER